MSPLRTLFAADVETDPPGPVSGPNERCFWTTIIMRSPGKYQHTVLTIDRVGFGPRRTNLCMSFHSEDIDAFHHSGARVVDAVEHRL